MTFSAESNAGTIVKQIVGKRRWHKTFLFSKFETGKGGEGHSDDLERVVMPIASIMNSHMSTEFILSGYALSHISGDL